MCDAFNMPPATRPHNGRRSAGCYVPATKRAAACASVDQRLRANLRRSAASEINSAYTEAHNLANAESPVVDLAP